MPTMWAIARHWAESSLFDFDLDIPYCFACGQIADCDIDAATQAAMWNSAIGSLERAHLADRCDDGLDGPQNIVPLCPPCHRIMPVFGFGEGPDAIKWVKESGGYRGFIEQIMKNHPRFAHRDG